MQMKTSSPTWLTSSLGWDLLVIIELWKEVRNIIREYFYWTHQFFPNLVYLVVCMQFNIQTLLSGQWKRHLSLSTKKMKERTLGFIFVSVQSNLLGIQRIYTILCSKILCNYSESIIKLFNVGKIKIKNANCYGVRVLS